MENSIEFPHKIGNSRPPDSVILLLGINSERNGLSVSTDVCTLTFIETQQPRSGSNLNVTQLSDG